MRHFCLNQNHIISVKEARKILGKEAMNMTDVMILKLVDDYDAIAAQIIQNQSVLISS